MTSKDTSKERCVSEGQDSTYLSEYQDISCQAELNKSCERKITTEEEMITKGRQNAPYQCSDDIFLSET